ncbi:hypothetical protein Goshw_004112 [Gossypium schwendimanii]|uniref:Uncharacterized protein n=1 Tax=Gossypium schwendimanii TaxID=34291 RepID=A0A7J9L0Z4_GOSSC|nr:hypothetical protein [Gossypium schwendimanii]
MGIPLQPDSVGPTYSNVWLDVMPYYGLITLRPYSSYLMVSILDGKPHRFRARTRALSRLLISTF